jgi:hypothetical protein
MSMMRMRRQGTACRRWHRLRARLFSHAKYVEPVVGYTKMATTLWWRVASPGLRCVLRMRLCLCLSISGLSVSSGPLFASVISSQRCVGVL